MTSSNGHNGSIIVWVEPAIEFEGDQCTAIFEKLGIAGMGSTEKEAVQSLIRHVEAHCAALLEKGFLREALDSRGIRWKEEKNEIPVLVA